MEFRFSDIAGILGHKPSPEEKELVITGFSTDTRTLVPGMMFIAIPGENFDGGDFVERALESGAAGAITERVIAMPGVITVENTVKALGDMASWHRKRMPLPLVAVTGSTGKTSTRNFIRSVLSVKYNVHTTEGNLNNHIGLPMSLLRINEGHDVSVVEMGMSGPGEIDYLARLAEPDIGVMTNIGMSHIGMLGSRENIFRAKTEMIPHIKKGGKLVINGDDEFLSKIKKGIGPEIISFGKDGHNDIVIGNPVPDAKGCYSFDADGHRYRLAVRGYHNIQNAAAAICIGKLFDVPESGIQEGLLGFTGERMRLDIHEKDGITIINDAYNASPDSMAAALSILRDFGGRHIAVLGDMLEMGGFSEKAHTDVGRMVPGSADMLVCCGRDARFIAMGAVDSGMDEDSVMVFADSGEAGAFLTDVVRKGDVLLVKGSRGMKMENVIECIEAGGI